MYKQLATCLGLVLMLTVSGCLTTAKMKLQVVEKWIGQDETSLVGNWGTPYRTIEDGDTKFLKYRRPSSGGTGLDMYTFQIDSNDIIEAVTVKRVLTGLELDHWP